MNYKQTLGLILLCLFLSCNDLVNGRHVAKSEGKQVRDENGSMFRNLIQYQPDHPNVNVHHAYYYSKKINSHGAVARVSVWGIPDIADNAQSSSAILLSNGKNMMGAGFHVYPGMYAGNKELHFFTTWTANVFKTTGCFNTLCPGYVLSNESNALIPGGIANPLSTYDGDDYFYEISIKKDETTGDWSLYYNDGNNLILCGWWPKTLFSDLADKAASIEFGGNVAYPQNETGPALGSGHLPNENKKESAYFSHIRHYNTNGDETYIDGTALVSVQDKQNCYQVTSYKQNEEEGHVFFYGGPPGCQN